MPFKRQRSSLWWCNSVFSTGGLPDRPGRLHTLGRLAGVLSLMDLHICSPFPAVVWTQTKWQTTRTMLLLQGGGSELQLPGPGPGPGVGEAGGKVDRVSAVLACCTVAMLPLCHPWHGPWVRHRG